MARSTFKLKFIVPLTLVLVGVAAWWLFEVNTPDRQQVLIQDGVDPDDLNKADKDGNTALIRAAAEGHIETVHALIKAGADLNKANKNGDTALILAARQGHTEAVQALIQAGADLNKADEDGDTALIRAPARGWGPPVQVLIQAGAGLNKVGEDGDTALIEAAREGRTETVKP